jgi:hypothetical protein
VHNESETPFVISVIPVVGSTQAKPSQRGTASGRAPVRKSSSSGTLPPGGSGFYYVKLEAPAQPNDTPAGEKPEGKPFAVGKMKVTADVELDFDLSE